MSAALDTHDTIGPPERSGEARSGGGPEGRVPLPPAPSAGNVDPKVIRDQLNALKRQQRDARKQTWMQRVRGVDRSYWLYAGVGVAAVVGMLGCRSYQADQRETALALASIGASNRPAEQQAEPETIVVDGIPNPLDSLKLTAQARWMVGETDGVLPPTRSAIVITALLEQVDLCAKYVGLNDRAAIVVSDEPAAGFVPLVQCTAKPAATAELPAPTTSAAPATTVPGA